MRNLTAVVRLKTATDNPHQKKSPLLENVHDLLSFPIGEINILDNIEQSIYGNGFRDISFCLYTFLRNSLNKPTGYSCECQGVFSPVKTSYLSHTVMNAIPIGLTGTQCRELFTCFLIYDFCVPNSTTKRKIEGFPTHVPLLKQVPQGGFWHSYDVACCRFFR